MNFSDTSDSVLSCSSMTECMALYLDVDLGLYQFIETFLKLPIQFLILLISLVGASLNITAFVALRECTCEFNQFLSIFTMNRYFQFLAIFSRVIYNSTFICFSLVLNTNELVNVLLHLLSPLMSTLGFELFVLSVYSPVGAICYTFGGFLDILIMFERMQLFIESVKSAFKRLSAKQWSALFFFISLLAVLPIKIYLEPVRTTVVLNGTNSTETVELYKAIVRHHSNYSLFSQFVIILL